jgi:hypothetical protein
MKFSFTETYEKIKAFLRGNLALLCLVLILSVEKDLAGGKPVGLVGRFSNRPYTGP